MEKNSLKLIYGGLDSNSCNMNWDFVSAYVTDTRLMGVLVLHIYWINKTEDETISHLHQFYYFDAEEYGLDTFKHLQTDDYILLENVENTMIGGLGGKKKSISLNEAIYLVKKFINFNLLNNIELPEDLHKCDFFLSEDSSLDDVSIKNLNDKICAPITSTCETINYFMMRLFGKDIEAANYLTDGFDAKNCINLEKCSTLYKNTINIISSEDNNYLCESLIEVNNGYRLITSQVTTYDFKIVKFKKLDELKVSPEEAAMILSQNEYITVYKYTGSRSSFNRLATKLTAKSMITHHHYGDTYMLFNPDNSHVNSTVYRLNGDVLGVYYFSHRNELILSAYTYENIKKLENDIIKSDIMSYVLPISKYKFDIPLLYDFVQSNIDNFEKFVELIQDK